MRDINILRPITEEYVKPEVGTMLMFPAWLRHGVNPFFGEGERRTMSANINITLKKKRLQVITIVKIEKDYIRNFKDLAGDTKPNHKEMKNFPYREFLKVLH